MLRRFLAFFLVIQACSGRSASWSEAPAIGGQGPGGSSETPSCGGANQAGSVHTGSGAGLPGAAGAVDAVGGSGGSSTSDPDVAFPFAPPLGKAALLIGQSGRRAHLDYVMGTESVPAGGSVYAELYSGKFSSFEQAAFVDYLARYYPGSLVEVGLSWEDNRVSGGYCDLADPACVASGGAIARLCGSEVPGACRLRGEPGHALRAG